MSALGARKKKTNNNVILITGHWSGRVTLILHIVVQHLQTVETKSYPKAPKVLERVRPALLLFRGS